MVFATMNALPATFHPCMHPSMHFAAVRFFRICILVHNACCRCNCVVESILLTWTTLFMFSKNLAQHIVTNHKRIWSEGHGS
eukprot:CAMPEP_0183452560 /NCGR_PEP_ID=MMETSP0370-20130417/118391_1 /TAXON_ID=268820 /ORGANISM="Peridinium aciculiferum, Strain PAER-2" /LENGTH=81 /DNA_ID=CAMNT_0025643877 /DNA_START=209 /DNA_END=450 /DNA_ORIENTATION=-